MTCTAAKTERWVVLVFSMFENFFHSATLFGWPSFVYVLIDLGYYSNLCPSDVNNISTTVGPPGLSTRYPSSDAPGPGPMEEEEEEGGGGGGGTVLVVGCDAQEARLLLIYTIASSLVPCSMLLGGLLFEKGGTLFTRIMFSISLLVAYLCIAASSPEVPDLLFPGAILMGLAGIIIAIATFELSNLFPSKRSTVIGLTFGMSDSGASVLLIVKVLHDYGLSMNAFFYALAASTLLFTVNTVMLPRTHIPWPLPEDYRLPRPCTFKESTDTTDDTSDGKNGVAVAISDPEQKEDTFSEANRLPAEYSSAGNGVVKSNKRVSFTQNGEVKSSRADAGVQANFCEDNQAFEDDDGQVTTETDVKYGLPYVTPETVDDCPVPYMQRQSQDSSRSVADHAAEKQRWEDFPTACSALKSPMFLLMTLWTISCQGQIFFVIGIMNSWLTWLAKGDEEAVSFYTNLLAIISIGSIIGCPLTGYVFDRQKHRFEGDSAQGILETPYSELRRSWVPVTFPTAAAIGMSVFLMIPSLPVQIGTFIMLTVVRSMFYAASGAIVPISFPMQMYPTIFGTINFLAGVFSFLQYPLFILIQEVLDGDPRWVVGGFLIANVLSMGYPAYIYFYAKKREEIFLQNIRGIEPPILNDKSKE